MLSYFGMDIHRGQAMTTPDGLVLDVFQFADEGGFLRLNAGAPAEISRMLENVVAGSIDVPTLLRGKLQSLVYRNRRHGTPIVRFDNDHSRSTPSSSSCRRCPGAPLSDQPRHLGMRLCRRPGADLHRRQEGRDVLHITKQGKKLTESEQVSLREGLERMLEDTHEAR